MGGFEMKLKTLWIKNNDSHPCLATRSRRTDALYGYQCGCPHTLLSCQEALAVPNISLGSECMKTPKSIVQNLSPSSPEG